MLHQMENLLQHLDLTVPSISFGAVQSLLFPDWSYPSVDISIKRKIEVSLVPKSTTADVTVTLLDH